MLQWILLALSVALIIGFAYGAVAVQRRKHKWQRDREWGG